MRLPLAVAAAIFALVSPASASTSSASSRLVTAPPSKSTATATASANPEAPVPVAASDFPPPAHRLSSNQVLAIADALPKLRKVRAEFPGSYPGAYLKGPNRWQVSWFSRKGKEIAQATVSDATGRVLEQWSGFQIAWTMARGYPGAFGRHVNALYVWIPLCVLFFVPFFDWRRPLRLLHLDLLALLSFSLSLALFNHGRIYASTPLAYPPLAYLLARMLYVARVGRRSRGQRAMTGEQGADGAPTYARRPPPARLLVPAPWLAIGLLFLVGFRIGLNVTDSNVIDVGYAGVIGAQRVVHGKPLYGGWPTDNEHGDTYGPVAYEAYVPFRLLFGWSGRWDDLPAAHAAAIVFDLLAMILLFALGRRIRGPGLGIALAYAWAAYPFTLFAMESNSNDTLLAVLVLAALLVASSPPARGVFAALAALAKFAPLALAPVLCTHGLQGADRRSTPHSGHVAGSPPIGQRALAYMRIARTVLLFAGAFVLTAAVVSIPALAHDSLHTIFQRTVSYQADRESPFSIWGLYGTSPTGGPYAHWLPTVQTGVQAAAVVLAVALAFLPRRADLVGLAAVCAAALVAVQLGIDHWFYLYIPWFFGLVMLALLGELNWTTRRAPTVAASESARSPRPVAA